MVAHSRFRTVAPASLSSMTDLIRPVLVAGLLVMAGALASCRKPTPAPAREEPSVPAAAESATTKSGGASIQVKPTPPAAEDPVAKFLNSSEFADLTKAYQVFYYQKKRHATDVQELVQAGYLRSVPPPPPGRKYGYDQKNLKVTLSVQ